MKRTLVNHCVRIARFFVMGGSVFTALRQYLAGDVLDVGGSDFFLAARKRGVAFKSWTVLEKRRTNLFELEGKQDPALRVCVGDGTNMRDVFADGSFDTVLNLSVLEHVMEPLAMVAECARVLRPGGYAIFLIPQTASIHNTPEHYYNFTRFWSESAIPASGLQIVELQPLGGLWSSIAACLFFFFLQAAGVKDRTYPTCRRNAWFPVLLPFMIAYALFTIPIALFFSLGDLSEQARNHLVVARRPD